MKLTIKKDQADVKGMFGGHKGVSFKLAAKCEIGDAERQLIEKYKVGDMTVASRMSSVGNKGETREVRVSVNDLIQGSNHQTDDLGELQSLEEQLKSGCLNLKVMLKVMSTFGGEEVFEI